MPDRFIPVAAACDRRSSRTVVTDRRGFAPWWSALLVALTVMHPLSAAEMSELAPLAAHALLLDVAKAGDQYVAVGDHGDIVLSRDHGRTWIQSLAPTRALLTAVSFPDARHGWVVGHEGVILHTDNGGQTWRRQDDGRSPDDVYLDVLFRDPLHGFVVGAYGKFLATSDGGKTWIPGHPIPDEVHYNRISAGSDGRLYLSGENGTTLISVDGGGTWRKIEVPYDGSLFGVLPLENGRLVIYGLRGHILRSDNQGTDWQPIDNDIKVLIMGGASLGNGLVLLGGQGGNFFVSRNGGRTFSHWQPAGFDTSVADLIDSGDGAVITVGEAGAVRVTVL